jgi:glycosyltransferase involved in cell wall biosynthesis
MLPFISIVTPFYNTADYLEECINSVLNQSHKLFEYILVNNCSSDDSANIAERYCKLDKRIKLYHNENFLSQVQNYNCALRYISRDSKYVKVVQADDWIFPNCIEEMLPVAEKNPNVGIVSSYRLYGNKISLDGLSFESTIVSGQEICHRYLKDNLFVFGTPTSIMVRSNLVRNRLPFYNEKSPLEDIEVCLEISKDHDFGFVHQVLTFSRRDNDGILTSIRDYRPFLLNRYIALLKYGQFYLTERELKTAVKNQKKQYFNFLGKNLLWRWDKKFWDYHRQGLDIVGYKLKKTRLSGYAFASIVDLVFNPLNTLKRFWGVLAK